jgi:glutamate synthase (NADPH/NADH) large chain
LLADPLRHDVWRLTTLIRRHAQLTNSSRATEILDNLDEYLPRFYKVVPVEYRRAFQSGSA